MSLRSPKIAEQLISIGQDPVILGIQVLMAVSAEDLRTALITRIVHVFLNLREIDLAIWIYK